MITIFVFIFGVLEGHGHFAGVVAGVGIVVYVALRLLRGVLDPLIIWLLTRSKTPAE